MGATVELPVTDCRACGAALRGCWEFAPDDLFCGICGQRVFRLVFREEVDLLAAAGAKGSARAPVREVWLYASPDAPLVLVAWGVHGIPGQGRGLSAVFPELDYHASAVRFEIPGLGPLEFGVELAKKPAAPAGLANPDPYAGSPLKLPRAAVAVMRLVPKSGRVPVDQLPDDGARGRIDLAGPHGGSWPARLLRLPSPVLEFLPPDDSDHLPELIGYQAASGSAEVELTVTARARAVLTHLSGDKGLSGIRRATYRGVRLPFEFTRGQQVRLGVVFDADPRPQPRQPLTIKWGLAGIPGLIDYRCLVTLHPRPRLTIRPNGDPPEEIAIGGRPVEFELLLDPAVGEGETVPVIRTPPEVRLDPADGGWLRVTQFPPAPFNLTGPYPLRLTIETARLDRAGMSGRLLVATIALTDQAETEWAHTIRLRAVRLRADDGVLALDWGTTNTCAAHGTGPDASPRPLALPPPLWREDPPDYEQFPSVVYFEDVSDPKQPVFHVGPMARDLAKLRSHPECLIHSLKRRFRAQLPVYVRDEAGREHAYPVEDIVRRVLLRLIELAEHELGREVRHVGVTFPTKWPAVIRRRFDLTLRRVAADLTAVRRHGPVEVYMARPDIDEANAVALNVLRDLQDRGKLVTGRPFTLVAYDYGGGTIDTSVLQVTWDEGADPPLTTRYLGIGGRGDFGGDELTRATVLLLRDRVNRVLETNPQLAAGVRYVLPLHRPGDPPDPGGGKGDPNVRLNLDALKNWEVLWEIGEEIKRGLCRPTPPADSDPIRQAIESRLGELACHPSGRSPAPDNPPPRSLEDLLQQAFEADRKPFFVAVRFGLKEVVDYPLGAPGGGPGFTVRERVRDTFLEVKAQLAEAGGLLADVIVLAGGGCRLPLVVEMARECLGPPPDGVAWDDPGRLIYNPGFAKQRVAHGKATYLALARESDILARGLARSVDVLHRPLVVTRPAGFGVKRETVVRVGEPVHAPDRWHPFPLTRGHVKTEGDHRAVWLAVMMWQDGKWVPTRLGYFDLDRAESPPPGGTVVAEPLPPLPAEGDPPTAELRLTRTTSSAGPTAYPSVRLELRVAWPDGRRFCHFPFVPHVPADELDERLQGECG